MPRFLLALAVALVLVHPASANASPVRHAAPAAPKTPVDVRSDFNGDGYEDVAISIFTEDVGAIVDAGAVEVMYGSATGLSTTGNQYWTENDISSADGSETLDMFGRSMAAGDLNGDGYSDLVIGIMHEDLEYGPGEDAGALAVLYGSPSGLTATGNQWWTEDMLSSTDGSEAGDLFARSLDVADFNGDGYGDLAVGIWYEIVDGQPDAGAAAVIYGSAAGLTAAGNQFWTQDTPGVPDDAQPNERMGSSVTGGDFNGDGYDDLAIGDPGEDPLGISGAGGAIIVYGGPNGLDAFAGPGSQLWTEDMLSSTDGPEDGDWFGRNVRSANFNNDAFADLVIAIPSEDVGTIRDAGSVAVLYGSAAGLTATGNQWWNQDSPNIKDQAETHDLFGRHEGVGDFNGDGYSDLAVGVVSEDIGTVTDAGAVNVIYGSAAGLTASHNQFWSQNTKNIKGVAEAFDAFGRAVTGLDYNGDGYDDLTVGVPGDTVAGLVAAGSVNVIYGTANGANATGNQLWNQNSPGMQGDGAEAGDLFGAGFPGQTAGGCGQGGTCTD